MHRGAEGYTGVLRGADGHTGVHRAAQGFRGVPTGAEGYIPGVVWVRTAAVGTIMAGVTGDLRPFLSETITGSSMTGSSGTEREQTRSEH